MKYVNWDNPKLRLSKIGFGCAPVMGRVSKKQALNAMAEAYDLGITHFDIASSYGFGEAEKVLGEFIADKRDKITITTKFGIYPSTASHAMRFIKPAARTLLKLIPALRGHARKQVGHLLPEGNFDLNLARSSIHRSLSQLKTDYLDILFLHDCSPSDELSLSLQAFLDSLVDGGIVRSWGVATKADWVKPVDQVLRSKPQVLQYEANALIQRKYSVDITGRNLPVILHSPFGSVGKEKEINRLTNSTSFREWAVHNNINFNNTEILMRLILELLLFLSQDKVILCSMFSSKHVNANVGAIDAPLYSTEQLSNFWKYLSENVRNK